MKKSLFLLGMALLSVSSLFADTVEKNGVTYKIASADSVVSNSSTIYSSFTASANNTTSKGGASVKLNYSTSTSRDITINNKLAISSLSKNITLGGWSVDATDPNHSNYKSLGQHANQKYTVDDNPTEFAKFISVLTANDNLDFHTYSDVLALGSNILDTVKVVYFGDAMTWNDFNTDDWVDYNSKCLYYYTVEENYNKRTYVTTYSVSSIYQIDIINAQYNESVSDNITTNYVFNSVPTGIDWSGVESITLDDDITSVADGAFSTATDLKSFTSNSTSFTVDDNGFLYTKGYTKLVAVPAYTTSGTTLSGTADAQAVYNLNDNTTAVATNALANVSYVDIVSGIQIEASIGGTGNRLYSNGTQELKSGNSITSLVKSEIISFTETPTGIIGSGVLTKASLAKLISEHASDNMSYIDLSGENLPTGASLTTKQTAIGEVTGLPTNCLLFLPRGVTATGDNVVIGGANGSCENLVVADGTQFFSPYDFSAETATYSGRTFTENKFSTIILPFDITGSTYVEVNGNKTKFDGSNNGAFRVASLNSYATNGEIKFQYQDVLSQNKAFLLKANETFSKFVVSNGVSVKSTPETMATEKSNSDGAIAVFAGSFSKGTTKSSYATGTGAYGLTTTGDIKKVATGKLVNLNPYRAMFLLTEPTTTSEAKHTIRIFEDADAETGEEVIEDVTATDIEYASVKSADINVVPQVGKIIVTANGDFVNVANVAGASCFSGKVNGQQSIELPAGVYVVNGKKYIVK